MKGTVSLISAALLTGALAVSAYAQVGAAPAVETPSPQQKEEIAHHHAMMKEEMAHHHAEAVAHHEAAMAHHKAAWEAHHKVMMEKKEEQMEKKEAPENPVPPPNPAN